MPIVSETGAALDALRAFLTDHPFPYVLTGAGVSTASGIPGYRDRDGRWRRSAPVLYQDFVRSAAARRRYWRRSMAGWPLLARARPNATHDALATLERRRLIAGVATQNVDGLHARAGSERLIELHGNIHHAACLQCGRPVLRQALQRRLQAANPHLQATDVQPAPDGDADVDDDALAQFVVPDCAACGGTLKPGVVFFGENVPQPRVAAGRSALEQGGALLVVGSSLAVYSGYRFCEWAAALGRPIAAINQGRTRADPLLSLKIDADCGPLLAALAGV